MTGAIGIEAAPRAYAEIYDAGLARLLETQTVLLESGGDVSVHSVVLRGDAAAMLLEYAQRAAVDLIAVGTHGQSPVGRQLIGSASTALLRGAPRAVLVAPPPDQDTRNDN